MSLAPDLRLGLRLAIGAGRHGLARLLLIASGIALAVGLLLTALGIFWAEGAVDQREAARQFLHTRRSVSPDHLLVEYADTAFGDRPITIRFMAAVGDPSPPPWLERVPDPGEIVASRALADLLASDAGAVLRPRLRGVVVDTLTDRWTLQPSELVAYVGVEPGQLRARRASIVIGYGRESQGVEADAPGFAIDQPLTQVLFAVSVGLLIPIVVFVATGARLSASARESRLAAIRLVGATPAQIRVVATAESLLAAASGCVLGGALFLAARPFIAAEAPPGDRWFPSDIAAPSVVIATVIGAVIVLSVAVSLLSLRRVVVTPLGVVRKEGKPIRSTWRWLTLASGLGGLAVLMLSGRSILANDRIALPFVVVCYGLTGIGAAAAAPMAGSAIATVLAKVWQGPGVLLGARRLRADPRTAGRTVAGVVIVVIAATVTSLYVGVYEAEAGDSSFPSSLRASTVIIQTLGGGPVEYDPVTEVPGVEGVAPIWLGYTKGGHTVLIGDCDALDAAVQGAIPSCVSGDVFVPGSKHRRLRSTLNVGLETGSAIRLDIDPSRVERLTMNLGQWAYSVFVPLSAAPPKIHRHPPSAIFVATDGDPVTLERIRNALFPSVGTPVSPRGDRLDYVDEVPLLVGGAVTLGLLITFAIAAATLLITSVDAIGERRRSLAALSAVGVSRGVLRRALSVETALPMLAGVALGLGSAIGGTWMLWRAIVEFEQLDEPIPIYWRSLGAVIAFALVATVVATLATFPSLGRAIRPESLRTE